MDPPAVLLLLAVGAVVPDLEQLSTVGPWDVIVGKLVRVGTEGDEGGRRTAEVLKLLEERLDARLEDRRILPQALAEGARLEFGDALDDVRHIRAPVVSTHEGVSNLEVLRCGTPKVKILERRGESNLAGEDEPEHDDVLLEISEQGRVEIGVEHREVANVGARPFTLRRPHRPTAVRTVPLLDPLETGPDP